MKYNFDERQFIESAAWAYYNSYEIGLNIIKLANKELPVVSELIAFFDHQDINKLDKEIKNIFEAVKKSIDQSAKKA